MKSQAMKNLEKRSEMNNKAQSGSPSAYGIDVSTGQAGRAHQTPPSVFIRSPESSSTLPESSSILTAERLGEPLVAPGERLLLDQAPTGSEIGTSIGTSISVSVIVATYRRSGTIAPLLNDLASQRFDSIEVIIVNDGGPVAIHHEVPQALPFRVRVVERPNGGPAAARHTGIRLSRGEVIVIVDDDMRLEPSFIAGHLAAIERGADVVYGVIDGMDNDDSLFTRFHQRHIDLWLTEMRAGGTPRGDRLCTGNVAFTRTAYDEVGGFDRSLVRCEDRDLGIRLEFAQAKFAFAPQARSLHRSDHVDVEQWRRRSAIYGSSDATIADKHPGHSELSPWAFLSVLPPVSHPFLVLIALIPPLAGPAGSAVYGIAQALERRGRGDLAVRLAGLTYGIEYYRGAGTQWGGAGRSVRELRKWMRAGRPGPEGHTSVEGPTSVEGVGTS
jgi:GT2 family glycosyltransferase